MKLGSKLETEPHFWFYARHRHGSLFGVFMRSLVLLLALFPGVLSAEVPTVQARGETAPIPMGLTDSDDAAIWANPESPEQSLILGTSKYAKDGQGGLGVYNLKGEQLQFFAGSKINSVDIMGDLAIASNRSIKALDIYRIEGGQVSFLRQVPLRDAAGKAFEPYGLCLGEDLNQEIRIFLPTKSGVLFEYRLNSQWDAYLHSSLEVGAQVSAEGDAFIKEVVTKAALAEGDAAEVEKQLSQRFILEGCTFHAATQTLYVGMENYGIWAIDAEQQAKLVIPVQRSWTDSDNWPSAMPRVTDDIEGIDIIHSQGHDFLVFSSQGISEFVLYDLANLQWLGNFKVSFRGSDPVTLTDGVAVQSASLGTEYPSGLLVVHDDANTEADGTRKPGNYKIVSVADIIKLFKLPDSNGDRRSP